LLTFVIVHREIVVVKTQATVICYKIGRIEYSNANVFFGSMISNEFYAFDKQEELQSRVKGQIPKKVTASANSWAFDVWKSWAQKYIFVSRNGGVILFQHLRFHARKLDYWLSFLVMEVRRQDKQDIQLIRCLIW